MTSAQQTDERLKGVETVRIPFDEFKKALRRNYLDDGQRRDRSNVLRLHPPFEATMKAEYYESERGQHYSSDWSEKPFHIPPELLIIEGSDSGFQNVADWPTRSSTRARLHDDELPIDDDELDNLVAEGRAVFWSDLRRQLPDTFDLGDVHGIGGYEVAVEWVNLP